MKNKTYNKSFAFTAIKGVKITPDILAKINTFAIKELTADDVYVRKHLLAHNGIDRDVERFSEPLLEDYARTLPGKSFLEVHNTYNLPIGLFFDARTEGMTPEEFKSLTGEEINLPEGIDSARVILSWLYTLKAEFNDKLIANLDAGIYRHISIGFTATDRIPIRGEGDKILYYEYISPGEAREGSIVYLGAQQGATSLKKTPEINNINNLKPEGGKEKMEELKKFLEKMSKQFKTHFTEDNVIDEVKILVETAATKADTVMAERDKTIKDQGIKITDLEKKVTELTPLASDGKAYRSELVDDCIKMKAKLGDTTEKEEDQKSIRETVEKFDIDYLKKENEILVKRVEEKFDDKGQLKVSVTRDNSKDGGKENLLIPKTDSK